MFIWELEMVRFNVQKILYTLSKFIRAENIGMEMRIDIEWLKKRSLGEADLMIYF
jgi:hypothetical protein